jgi:hypothetical protein
MSDDSSAKAEQAKIGRPGEYRFEVAFITGKTPEVVTATRAEDVDGWTYFYVASGGWGLKVQSSVIHHITRGTPATATADRPGG